MKEVGMEKRVIRLYDGKRFTDTQTDIVREVALRLFVNGEKVVTIACTGLHLRELATGFLYSEGYIRSKEDLKEVRVAAGDEPSVHATTTGHERPLPGFKSIGSSGARGKGERERVFSGGFQDSGIHLTPQMIFKLMEQLHHSSRIHEATHGTHCSGLAGLSGMIVTREDIGRHNTIDMLGGYALLEGIHGGDKVLVTTGRVSSEIVAKVRNMGVPAIVSHSASTTGAVSLCHSLGMTLIGYVRKGTFRVYAQS